MTLDRQLYKRTFKELYPLSGKSFSYHFGIYCRKFKEELDTSTPEANLERFINYLKFVYDR